MRFLILDTIDKKITVCVYNAGKIISKADSEFRKASEIMFLLIEQVLEKAKIELKTLDFFAVVVGPGSFTGTRIGITAARIFAQLLDKKCVTLSPMESTQALVNEAKRKYQSGEAVSFEQVLAVYERSAFD